MKNLGWILMAVLVLGIFGGAAYMEVNRKYAEPVFQVGDPVIIKVNSMPGIVQRYHKTEEGYYQQFNVVYMTEFGRTGSDFWEYELETPK